MMPTVTTAQRDLAELCPEPVIAAVMCHRGPGASGLKKLFGSKDPSSQLAINNWLVLTPTALRIISLGGRTGMKPRKEVAAWPRAAVLVAVEGAEVSSYFASTGSSLDYRVHRLHITAADGTMLVTDVRSAPMLFGDDQDLVTYEAIAAESDPDVREAMLGLREMTDEVNVNLATILTGCGVAPQTQTQTPTQAQQASF